MDGFFIAFRFDAAILSVETARNVQGMTARICRFGRKLPETALARQMLKKACTNICINKNKIIKCQK